MRTIDVEFSYWPFLLRNNEIGTGKKGRAKQNMPTTNSSLRRISTQNCYAIRRPAKIAARAEEELAVNLKRLGRQSSSRFARVATISLGGRKM
jgi:hypothetical protein